MEVIVTIITSSPEFAIAIVVLIGMAGLAALPYSDEEIEETHNQWVSLVEWLRELLR
jgi:ABC-type dipeptide/oligopeptide/nickel transport system permease component